MKFCKDCKHYRNAFAGSEFAKCATRLNPVNGKADAYCSSVRRGKCGSEAYLFEPKPRFHIIRLALGVA